MTLRFFELPHTFSRTLLGEHKPPPTLSFFSIRQVAALYSADVCPICSVWQW